MEEDLKLGESYTVIFLLNTLSENYRQNIFLVSEDELDLIKLPRDKKYIVDKVQSLVLHKCIDSKTYTKNKTMMYFIRSEA